MTKGGYGDDCWGMDPWSGKENPRTKFHHPVPQKKRVNRVIKNQMRSIFTNNENMDKIQDNIKFAIQDNSLNYGVPIKITENYIAKIGEIILGITQNKSIYVKLQNTTKNDIGSFILIKNYCDSIFPLLIRPYENKTIDSQEYLSLSSYECKLLICTDANIWMSVII